MSVVEEDEDDVDVAGETSTERAGTESSEDEDESTPAKDDLTRRVEAMDEQVG
jgi:hypothetical protein